MLDDSMSEDEVEVSRQDGQLIMTKRRDSTRLYIQRNDNQKTTADISTRNSFLDLIGQNHDFDFKKIGSKSLAYDALQLRKMRAIYGKRGSFIVGPGHTMRKGNSLTKEQEKFFTKRKVETQEEIDKKSMPSDANFFHTLIIHPDSKWKSFFDVWILLLVG